MNTKLTLASTQFITHSLTNWSGYVFRDLPWKRNATPYTIWISEVILQQTQVKQGTPYFLQFLARFPSVSSLATAPEADVLKQWEGLGYYSRARNLHAAAKLIMEKHQGIFPTNYNDIRALPGIGAYTAAAIASFAYNQPYAVLDGNVYRVLSRVLGIETPINTPKAEKEFTTLAQQLLLQADSADQWNQTIMDFGALQCKPALPLCPECPLAQICYANQHNVQNSLPIKAKSLPKKNRVLDFFWIETHGKIYLEKRTRQDIWKGLYQLPSIERHSDAATASSTLPQLGTFKQILSHQIIHGTIYKGQPSALDLSHYQLIEIDDLSNFPFPLPLKKFLEAKL